jgi:uncharacterized protein YndB with AHSA1/START domain
MTYQRGGASSSLAGSLHTADGKATVRVEDRFSTGIDDLWSAVTDPERLARWVAAVDGDLRLGGMFHASFTSSWDGPGRVDVCEPPRRLLVTMSPGDEDQTVIEAELFPEGSATRLVVEERGLSLEDAYGHGAGWQVHVEDLQIYLAGEPARDWKTRWAELTPAYREQAKDLR